MFCRKCKPIYCKNNTKMNGLNPNSSFFLVFFASISQKLNLQHLNRSINYCFYRVLKMENKRPDQTKSTVAPCNKWNKLKQCPLKTVLIQFHREFAYKFWCVFLFRLNVTNVQSTLAIIVLLAIHSIVHIDLICFIFFSFMFCLVRFMFWCKCFIEFYLIRLSQLDLTYSMKKPLHLTNIFFCEIIHRRAFTWLCELHTIDAFERHFRSISKWNFWLLIFRMRNSIVFPSFIEVCTSARIKSTVWFCKRNLCDCILPSANFSYTQCVLSENYVSLNHHWQSSLAHNRRNLRLAEPHFGLNRWQFWNSSAFITKYINSYEEHKASYSTFHSIVTINSINSLISDGELEAEWLVAAGFPQLTKAFEEVFLLSYFSFWFYSFFLGTFNTRVVSICKF